MTTLDVIQGGEEGIALCLGPKPGESPKCGNEIPKVKRTLESGREVWALMYYPCPECGAAEEQTWGGARRLKAIRKAGITSQRDVHWTFHGLELQGNEDTGSFMHRLLTQQQRRLGVLNINAKPVDGIARWTRRPIASVYIGGNVGQGKTALACAMVDALLEPREVEERRRSDEELKAHFGGNWQNVPESRRWVSGRPQPRDVLYSTWRDLMWRITTKYKTLDRDAIGRVSRAGYLFIDDLGTWEGVDSKRKERATDAFEALLEYRYRNELPVVVTSNVPFADLRDRYGLRVADRLAEMIGTHHYQLRGPSWRQPPSPNPDGRNAR